ncbi:MAG: AtpZ/AtpI family protein [Phycisphaerae bacterium]|nr:AtpZ/AtpI family protein [Phycisphaerae bacterium]
MENNDSGGQGHLKWTGLGFEFAGVVAVFVYFGYKADERWHCGPWGVLIGAAIGVTGGIYWLAKEGMRMMNDLSRPRLSSRGKPKKNDSPEQRS